MAFLVPDGSAGSLPAAVLPVQIGGFCDPIRLPKWGRNSPFLKEHAATLAEIQMKAFPDAAASPAAPACAPVP
jgi:hypothetical protein